MGVGRPLGTGLQEQAPNHLRRLWPKATVVNAEGKGSDITESGDMQEEDRKGTTAEVSKVIRRCPKPRSYCCCGISSDDTCWALVNKVVFEGWLIESAQSEIETWH